MEGPIEHSNRDRGNELGTQTCSRNDADPSAPAGKGLLLCGMQDNSMQHQEVGQGPRSRRRAVMVRHDGACRIYGEVGRDGDKDGASVSVETVLNRMGDPILEKGGCFSGIKKQVSLLQSVILIVFDDVIGLFPVNNSRDQG